MGWPVATSQRVTTFSFPAGGQLAAVRVEGDGFDGLAGVQGADELAGARRPRS